ncbi:hypothetical protein HanIR_Chr09g0442281 [Helianthus annuus]|nr:hypothetical protein HanIR_Chr09g0442281 [Helianthus annuus]
MIWSGRCLMKCEEDEFVNITKKPKKSLFLLVKVGVILKIICKSTFIYFLRLLSLMHDLV